MILDEFMFTPDDAFEEILNKHLDKPAKVNFMSDNKQTLSQAQMNYCKIFPDNAVYGIVRDKAFEAGAKWQKEQIALANNGTAPSERTLIAAMSLQGFRSNPFYVEHKDAALWEWAQHDADGLLTHLQNTEI